MTPANIEKMKVTQVLVLTKTQTFWHYCIVFFFMIAPTITTINVYKYYITNTYTGVRKIEPLIQAGYIWVLPAIVFYFIQKRRLRFHVFNITIDKKTFETTVSQVVKELDWEIKKISNDSIVAKSGFCWRSWGEQITIIRDENVILLNSICDPDSTPSVASFGMNNLNRKTFERILLQNIIKL